MKNLVIIALSSLLLFSVSAGLSLWLKQSKEEAAQLAESKKDDKEKKSAAKDEHGKSTEKTEKEAHKETPADAAKSTSADHAHSAADDVGAKRDKLDKLKQQFEIVQHDLRLQQEALSKLLQQVAVESKAVKALADDAENRATILKTEKDTVEKALEKANEKVDKADKTSKAAQGNDAYDAASLEKTAQIIEKLDPEVAATMLQAMADKGNLDSAVKILSKMKDAKVATILSSMKDKEFGTQLVNKILASRPAKPAEPQK